MHGSFDRSRKSYHHIEQGRSIWVLALPAFVVIAVIVLAIIQPAMPKLISEAVQAEFVGPDLAPDITPTQFAQPGMITRTIRAN